MNKESIPRSLTMYTPEIKSVLQIPLDLKNKIFFWDNLLTKESFATLPLVSKDIQQLLETIRQRFIRGAIPYNPILEDAVCKSLTNNMRDCTSKSDLDLQYKWGLNGPMFDCKYLCQHTGYFDFLNFLLRNLDKENNLAISYFDQETNRWYTGNIKISFVSNNEIYDDFEFGDFKRLNFEGLSNGGYFRAVLTLDTESLELPDSLELFDKSQNTLGVWQVDTQTQTTPPTAIIERFMKYTSERKPRDSWLVPKNIRKRLF